MERDDDRDTANAERFSVPLGLLVLGFVLMVGFQTVQLIRERSNLFEIQLAQEPTVQEGAKLRLQLDSLAKKTAALADAGNPGAKAVIEEMRRQGITIKTN
ncbi:MAG TPA: hypothetical protein VHT04_04890 [Stellaceae bacterium]|jgi:hypothetical protein|nr:hypothetical protein [Stellaceae bacterium]